MPNYRWRIFMIKKKIEYNLRHRVNSVRTTMLPIGWLKMLMSSKTSSQISHKHIFIFIRLKIYAKTQIELYSFFAWRFLLDNRVSEAVTIGPANRSVRSRLFVNKKWKKYRAANGLYIDLSAETSSIWMNTENSRWNCSPTNSVSLMNVYLD